ncbi:MAG: hypothetical protein OEW45_03525 [Deltaproteobacteria bacterium]|nr:hypothetical protein [Deltaproteobacteria bacterium]
MKRTDAFGIVRGAVEAPYGDGSKADDAYFESGASEDTFFHFASLP